MEDPHGARTHEPKIKICRTGATMCLDLKDQVGLGSLSESLVRGGSRRRGELAVRAVTSEK